MSKKISDLDPFVGFIPSTADIPVSIFGTTYRTNPTQLLSGNSQNQESGLEIIDSVPSLIVGYSTPTLIKEYNLGILTNKNMLDFTFLFHKTVSGNENINCEIYLYDTQLNTSYLIGYQSNNGYQKSTGIQRYCSLQNDKIIVLPINTTGVGSQIGNGNENVEEIVINSANTFKIRVLLYNGWYSGSRQYFGKINLK